MIVDFDAKTIFSVDSCGGGNHEKDAEIMLTFFWLALLKKRAATRHSSRENAFMFRGDFDVLEWKHRQSPALIACQQTDSISCGVFTCMNIREIVQEQDILLGGRKRLRKSQVNQEKAALWRFCLFCVVAMKSKQCPSVCCMLLK
jgi:hypothetical protein